MKGTFTFLGTSASVGIPVIGCKCHVCLSKDPFNRRSRPAALIEIKEKKILLDVGPDYYHQALKHQVNHLDGLILTHTHYDHIAGLDDLRVYSFLSKKPLPVLASHATVKSIERVYSYLLEKNKFPKFSFQILEEEKNQVEFLDLELSYVFYYQIGMQVTGYRIGDLAFITDIKDYDDKLLEMIKGVKTLVISAIEWASTRAHIGIDEVIELSQKVGAQKVLITHVGHELDHTLTNKKLPSFMELAYDGLAIEFNV